MPLYLYLAFHQITIRTINRENRLELSKVGHIIPNNIAENNLSSFREDK